MWSLALVFFQGVLLLGYGYAHLLVRGLGLRATVIAHLFDGIEISEQDKADIIGGNAARLFRLPVRHEQPA